MSSVDSSFLAYSDQELTTDTYQLCIDGLEGQPEADAITASGVDEYYLFFINWKIIQKIVI